MPFFGASSNLQCVCEEWCTLSLILNLLSKHYHLIFFSDLCCCHCTVFSLRVPGDLPMVTFIGSSKFSSSLASLKHCYFDFPLLGVWSIHSILALHSPHWCFFSSIFWHLSLFLSLYASHSQVSYWVLFSSCTILFPWVTTYSCGISYHLYIPWWNLYHYF